jgi:hypothetical protein
VPTDDRQLNAEQILQHLHHTLLWHAGEKKITGFRHTIFTLLTSRHLDTFRQRQVR